MTRRCKLGEFHTTPELRQVIPLLRHRQPWRQIVALLPSPQLALPRSGLRRSLGVPLGCLSC